jgi:DNA-binding CsgD family transcriptional regulator
MKPQRARARVVVKARDPKLRSLIMERLSALEDVDVEQDGAPSGPARADGAVIEAEGRPALTQREVEVLELVAEGLANKEIAFRLGISTHTAKFHVESLLRKLSASNRTEAAKEGIRLGLIGV